MSGVPAYLARISFGDTTAADAGTLRRLHRAHMLHIPFENLDIGLKRPIACDADASVRKIVGERRGGFCYELNGAFAWLQRQLGFAVTLLSARVAREEGSYGPEFDHLTLRVDLEEPWLADVGFGDSFVEPLRLLPDTVQEQAAGKFRIIQQGEDWLELQRVLGGDWKPQYRFSLVPRELSEFAGMCQYHQTSAESHFTQKRICSMAIERGRITLSDRRLIITEQGRREERELTEEEWKPALERYFGVRL